RLHVGDALGLQREPVKAVRRDRKQVRQLSDGGKFRLAEQLHRNHAAKLREIELHVLRQAGQIRDYQDLFLLITANVGQHLTVLGIKKCQAAAAEGLESL